MASQKHLELLDHLRNYIQEFGESPKLVELVKYSGFSLGSINLYLARLENEGFIERESHKHRSIRLVDRSQPGKGIAPLKVKTNLTLEERMGLVVEHARLRGVDLRDDVMMSRTLLMPNRTVKAVKVA